jgi:diacylglycerol kinase family enzyme
MLTFSFHVSFFQPLGKDCFKVKVLLVHNPDAGNESRPTADELEKLIRDAGHTVISRSAEGDDWQNSLEGDIDLIAVAGGDGTTGRVAKCLIGKQIPFTILPMGTANNISKSFGLTDRPLEELIAGWARARPRRIDVGIARGPFGTTTFLEGVGVGLFSWTMSKLDARDNLYIAHVEESEEKISTVLEILLEHLDDDPLKQLKITLDGKDLSGQYLMVEAMNLPFIGPNLNLAPKADPSDGMLDVVAVTAEDRDQLRKYLSAEIGPGQASPGLPVHRGKQLCITWEGFDVHIDDLVWPGNTDSFKLEAQEIEITLDPRSLEILVP